MWCGLTWRPASARAVRSQIPGTTWDLGCCASIAVEGPKAGQWIAYGVWALLDAWSICMVHSDLTEGESGIRNAEEKWNGRLPGAGCISDNIGVSLEFSLHVHRFSNVPSPHKSSLFVFTTFTQMRSLPFGSHITLASPLIEHLIIHQLWERILISSTS
jgi:hypothetical protein